MLNHNAPPSILYRHYLAIKSRQNYLPNRQKMKKPTDM